MAKLKVMEARVLGFIASLGVQCGHLIQSTPEHILALKKAGDVDPHPDAVAYAKQTGHELVRVGEAADLGDDDVQVVPASQAVLEAKVESVDGGEREKGEQQEGGEQPGA